MSDKLTLSDYDKILMKLDTIGKHFFRYCDNEHYYAPNPTAAIINELDELKSIGYSVMILRDNFNNLIYADPEYYESAKNTFKYWLDKHIEDVEINIKLLSNKEQFKPGGNIYGKSILPELKAIKNSIDSCKQFNKALKEVSKIEVPTCKTYKDWHHQTIEYIKPLNQRIKELKEKHKTERKEHKDIIFRIKAAKLLAYTIASFFGAKTKYDLTGIIRIPKIY